MELRIKESYGKGLANDPGTELCGGGGDTVADTFSVATKSLLLLRNTDTFPVDFHADGKAVWRKSVRATPPPREAGHYWPNSFSAASFTARRSSLPVPNTGIASTWRKLSGVGVHIGGRPDCTSWRQISSGG